MFWCHQLITKGALRYTNVDIQFKYDPYNSTLTLSSGVAAAVGTASTTRLQVYLTGADTLQVWVEDAPYTPGTVLQAAAINLLPGGYSVSVYVYTPPLHSVVHIIANKLTIPA